MWERAKILISKYQIQYETNIPNSEANKMITYGVWLNSPAK